MSTSTSRLNDVDLQAVGGLIAKIQEQPSVGDTTWRADVVWQGGFRSEVRIRDFAPVPSDEPVSLGGTDTAPNPVEQLLGALGNCLAVGYAANAAASGIKIDALRISLEGDLDLHTFLGLRDGNAGYDNIRVTVGLTSEAPEDEIAKLHERVINTSPVGHTLSRAVPVSIVPAASA